MNNSKEIFMDNYCMQELECSCNNCNYKFFELTPLNYELVCFENEVGKKYFLPTYGRYGYMDLLEKLVDGWNSNERITKSVTDKFEIKLKELTKHDLRLFNNVKCPICKKR